MILCMINWLMILIVIDLAVIGRPVEPQMKIFVGQRRLMMSSMRSRLAYLLSLIKTSELGYRLVPILTIYDVIVQHVS